MITSKHVDLSEAAGILGTSKATARELLQAHRVKALRRDGGPVVGWDLEQVAELALVMAMPKAMEKGRTRA